MLRCTIYILTRNIWVVTNEHISVVTNEQPLKLGMRHSWCCVLFLWICHTSLFWFLWICCHTSLGFVNMLSYISWFREYVCVIPVLNLAKKYRDREFSVAYQTVTFISVWTFHTFVILSVWIRLNVPFLIFTFYNTCHETVLYKCHTVFIFPYVCNAFCNAFDTTVFILSYFYNAFCNSSVL